MFEVNVSAGGLPEVVERSRLTCLPEICWRSARSWRSAGGLLEVCQRRCELDCSSALHLKGWLLEVCQRSAGGRPEVYQVREPTTTTNARREVLFTHCGLKVHSHYSV